ncbi:MAG: glycosyltransferase [Deltaproteobacteria bacterium]|nr:glycosyltransferase [Deltaproteobacteria bacterium]
MTAEPKRVLMTSGHHWSSTFRLGTHHLASGFLRRGWEVAFVSNPVSPLHVFSANRRDVLERARIFAAGGRGYCDGRLWTYVPGALVAPTNKPLLRSEWVCRNWQSTTLPSIGRVLRRSGFGEVDLLYFDSPVQAGLLTRVAHRRSVFRIADRMDGFSSFAPAFVTMQRELAGRVDLVIYSARSLASYVEALGPRNSMLVPNGVDFRHFAEGRRETPPEYGSIPRPRAVYVGAMDEWFDFELVSRAAAEMPHVSFVLIGPDRIARARLASLPNLHVLGARPFDKVPSYLHHADAGIIPFDVAGHARLVHTVNPLKLYEYMACGLPVVAAAWRELEEAKSPARLYQDSGGFMNALRDALETPGDRGAAIEFARKADWDERVGELIGRLDSLGR